MKKLRLSFLTGVLASLLLIFAPVYSAQANYVSDAAITSEIKTKILGEKGLDSMDIKVKTTDGVVTLRGQVAKKSQVKLAEKIAQETKGVRKVKNKISVMPKH